MLAEYTIKMTLATNEVFAAGIILGIIITFALVTAMELMDKK